WAAMKCNSAKASFVTAWLFSSSLTIPRQASDDSTSVGKKCLRANVVLPDPLGPIRTTRDSLGMEIFIFTFDSRKSILFQKMLIQQGVQFLEKLAGFRYFRSYPSGEFRYFNPVADFIQGIIEDDQF